MREGRRKGEKRKTEKRHRRWAMVDDDDDDDDDENVLPLRADSALHNRSFIRFRGRHGLERDAL